jgi:hypothetical protein
LRGKWKIHFAADAGVVVVCPTSLLLLSLSIVVDEKMSDDFNVFESARCGAKKASSDVISLYRASALQKKAGCAPHHHVREPLFFSKSFFSHRCLTHLIDCENANNNVVTIIIRLHECCNASNHASNDPVYNSFEMSWLETTIVVNILIPSWFCAIFPRTTTTSVVHLVVVVSCRC